MRQQPCSGSDLQNRSEAMANESAASLRLACNIFEMLEAVDLLMDDSRDVSKSGYASGGESEILNNIIAEFNKFRHAIDVPDGNYPSKLQTIAAEGVQICLGISGAVETFQVGEIKPKWDEFARDLRKAWNKSKLHALTALYHLHRRLVNQTCILLRYKLCQLLAKTL
jgi:hypothetical protein